MHSLALEGWYGAQNDKRGVEAAKVDESTVRARQDAHI